MALIIHFCVGRPKEEASNGVLRSVYKLSEAQNNISGNSVYCLYFSHRNTKGRKCDIRLSANIFGILKAIQTIKFLAPDVIYFNGGGHWRFMCILAFTLVNSKSQKIIYAPRGAYSSGVMKRRVWWKRLIIRYIEVPLVKFSCQNVQALSEQEGIEIIKNTTIDFKKLKVVPNAILIRTNKYIPRKDRSDLKIVFCGRLDFYGKGLDLLLTAIKHQTDKGENISLSLIGPYLNKESEHKIANIILKDKLPVQLLGELYGEDKWASILESDIFVLPSRSEGLPTALLEVAATGMPCIASQETNLPKEAFEFGIIKCKLSAESLSIAISEASKMLNAGKKFNHQVEYIDRQFSIEKVVIRHTDAFIEPQ